MQITSTLVVTLSSKVVTLKLSIHVLLLIEAPNVLLCSFEVLSHRSALTPAFPNQVNTGFYRGCVVAHAFIHVVRYLEPNIYLFLSK